MQNRTGINYELLERYCANIDRNVLLSRDFDSPGADECLCKNKRRAICAGCSKNSEDLGAEGF